jgi:hypothetical protein
MNRFFASALLFACATFTSVGFAQNQSPDQSQASPHAAAPSQQGEGSAVSITGCLTKGSADGSYVITDQKTSQKYPFSGPPQLDKFVNQTVTLTGGMTSQGSDKQFRPDRIAPVSSTCEKAQ